MTPLPGRPCEHAPRCKRAVFDAHIVKNRGAPVALVLDAEPKTWQDGARLLITPTGGEGVTVLKLTAATIHNAFGSGVRLFVEHREVCQAEARRTTAKKKGTGHA